MGGLRQQLVRLHDGDVGKAAEVGFETPDALVVGLRIMLRSSSVDELTEVGQRPVSNSASRTFMLPRFGRWGHAS